MNDNNRGHFVVLVGPDGVGKSSVASALIEHDPTKSVYFHFRPPVRRALMDLPERVQPIRAKRNQSGWRVIGWLRLIKNFLHFWAGYVAAVGPARRRGQLVIGDRWAYGYLVQPIALGFGGPVWLAKLMVRWLPQPDIVVNLVAAPEVIRQRKAELDLEAIRAELEAWRLIPARRLVNLSAEYPARSVAQSILEVVRRL